MDLITFSAWQWQEELQQGHLTSEELALNCLDQIEKHNHRGLHLNAVINISPVETVRRQAISLDDERRRGSIRGPLHGIPVIIKDVFATGAELGMPTTAGMIIIAKANLTELCGRRTNVTLGWSALAGQTQSPYIKGGVATHEAPCGNSLIAGSSSGSAAAVAAGFAPISIGTETSGSVVIPANRAALYSIKISPKRASTLMTGALRLSKTYDGLGPMTKSARDLRNVTNVLLGKMDQVRREQLSQTIESRQGSKQMPRLGFVSLQKWQYPDTTCPLTTQLRDELAERYQGVIQKLRQSEYDVVQDVTLPANEEVSKFRGDSTIGMAVNSEFRKCFAHFAESLTNHSIRTLDDFIKWNDNHKEIAMPPPFGDQKYLLAAANSPQPSEQVQIAIEHSQRAAATDGIDLAMAGYGVDLIIGPGDSDLNSLAACAGYPIGTMPLSMIQFSETNSRPEGLCVIGKEEENVVDFLVEFEKTFPARALPQSEMLQALCA